MSSIQYCYYCGGKNLVYDGVKHTVCTDCGREFFLNPAASIGVIIENREKNAVLILIRSREPGKGLWDLPGGFVDPGESAEQAARREVQEELGLGLKTLHYVASSPNTYAYAGMNYPTCDLVFAGTLDEGDIRLALEENSACLWVPREELKLSLEKIAFESLRTAVRDYLSEG